MIVNNNNYNGNANNQRRFANNNLGTPVRSSSGSRQTASLLASLDKSILQIRDWLTLLEGMVKKDKVDIVDRGHIYHMLERQKVSFAL